MNKLGNQAWKNSGTTLPFKEWIDRENKKMQETKDNFLPLYGVDIPDVSLDTSAIDTVGNNIAVNTPKSNVLNKNKVLGLDSGVLIFSGVLITLSIAYYVYTKVKDKNSG